MKRILVLLTCMLLAINIAACGDDSETGGGTANNAVDNNDTNNDQNNDTNNDTNNDENNDANNAPNNDGGPECGNGVCEPGETPDSCGQDCEAGTPADYDYDVPGAYLSQITLVTDANIGADLNGDGQPDNALGALLNDLGGLLGDTDLNAQLAEAIADGSLALGTTWPSFKGTGPADSNDVDIHFFLLEDADGDPSTKDEFLADPASFIPGTASPLITFDGASVSGGALDAGPSQFALSIPLGGVSLDVVVDRAGLTGDVSGDANGIDIAGGTLSGAVSLASIVDALNGYLQSDSCSCLGLNGPLIDLSAGIGPQACSGMYDDSTCADEGQDICSTIAGACVLAVPVIAGQTDIDLNGDGDPDAISVYLELEMSGTNISGPGTE